MKLFILRPKYDLKDEDNPWKPWYDKCFGFVISAENEEEARNIAHENGCDENRGWFCDRKISNTQSPWKEEKYSSCKELIDMEKGIIMADIASA